MKSLLQVGNNINLEPAWPSHLFLIFFSLFKKYFSDLFTTEGRRKKRKWLNTNVISISKYFVFSVQRAAPRCPLWFKNNFYVLGLSDLFTTEGRRKKRKWLNTNVISISKCFVFSVLRAAPQCPLWFKNNFYVLGLSDLFTKKVMRRCAFRYLARSSSPAANDIKND